MRPRSYDVAAPLAGKSLDYASKGQYFNATLARGIQILGFFDEQHQQLALADIARMAGMDRATALRFLSTLCQLGYLERSPVTKGYRPAPAVLEVSYVALSSSNLLRFARNHLELLASRTSETVNLGVLSGREVLYVHRIAQVELLMVNVFVGSRLPLHSTSMGKVLLAHLPPPELGATLNGYEFRTLGPNTIVERTRLERELDVIRHHGYAIQDEESSAGLRGIAAPIQDASGKVIAAVNIAVPAIRITTEDLKRRFRPLIVETGLRISKASRTADSRSVLSESPC